MALSRKLMGEPRLIMPLRKKVAAAGCLLGRYNYTRAMPELKEHRHPGVFEIVFLVRGCQTYQLKKDIYRLTGGDVFLTFPDEEHSSGGLPEEKGVVYWLNFPRPKKGESFLGLHPVEGKRLVDGLFGIKSRHFRGSWTMKNHLDEITGLFHRPMSDLEKLKLIHHVRAFVLEVLIASRQVRRAVPAKSLAPVIAYLHANLGEPFSLPQLASMAGLSLPRFKVRFKMETGMPPGEFILRTRVTNAEKRLREGRETVTEIAYDLGFSTSQYFATVFKRFTGKSPSEFRRGKIKRDL